jgi:hypothetical protein
VKGGALPAKVLRGLALVEKTNVWLPDTFDPESFLSIPLSEFSIARRKTEKISHASTSPVRAVFANISAYFEYCEITNFITAKGEFQQESNLHITFHYSSAGSG